MRAVNLIPADLRRGTAGIGKSGGAVYVVMGALGGLLLLACLYAIAYHQVSDRNQKLAKATQESALAQSRAAQLAPYTQFAALRGQRDQSISALAATRFDWPSAMRNLASALPTDVHLSAFSGNLGGSPGATSAPAPAPASAASGASGPQPTVHITGCATSHTEVGDVINRLRGVPGVSAVVFASSTKGGAGSQGAGASPASSSSSSSSAGGCAGAGPAAQFDLTVDFTTAKVAPNGRPSSAPGVAPPAASPAANRTAPASGASATPTPSPASVRPTSGAPAAPTPTAATGGHR